MKNVAPNAIKSVNARLLVLLFSASLLSACGEQGKPAPVVSDPAEKIVQPAAEPQKIVVYSARKEHLIKPLFDKYTEKTGVKIEYITDKAGSLLARLKSEGPTTPADMLLTTDVGNLWQAQKQGVLQPVNSQVLANNVPEHLREKNNHWFGLTQRSRIVVYASDRVKPEELSTYEDLADARWKGRLCLRTSKKVYNQSLVASFITHLGQDKTKAVIEGWVDNLAVDPFSNDTAAMNAVMAGQCDVTIVNTYYYGGLEAKNESGSLKIFWPNQGEAERGVHMNISGAGITKHAKHSEAAIALMEWLSGEEAQGMLAGLNMEFPVNQAVQPVAQVTAWGTFNADKVALSDIAGHQIEAVRLIDEAGYQ